MILPQIDITISDDGWGEEADLSALVDSAIKAAAVTAGLNWPENAELSVLFTNDAEMTSINGEWRNKQQPTNVLSFPGSDVAIGEASDVMIGDLVFALETIQREAKEQEKSFHDHLTHLTIHGFLHLFGYDHIEEEQAVEMEALEITSLAALGINDPYAIL